MASATVVLGNLKGGSMYIKNAFILFSFLIFGCVGGAQVVQFSEIRRIDFSFERQGYLVFRAEWGNSAESIVNYQFYKDKNSQNKYYLFFTKEFGNKKPVSAIECPPTWAGVKLSVPIDSFNPKTDKIFYKDQSGEHNIGIGTNEGWVQYLTKLGLKNINPNSI